MTRPRRPVFDLLLRTFPAPFRRRFGAAMREAYDAGCLDRQGDPMRLLAFRLRTLADLVAAGLRERRRPAGRPRGPEDPSGRWGGMRLSAQDARLGLRMLGKHPALTLVAVFALAVGIPVGLAPTHLANALEAPLPVPEGRRIQLLRYWNPVTSRPEPTTLADLRRWRGVLSTFGALGAARTADYDVATGDALAPPVRGAEVTAAAFDLLRVPPLLGRVLDAADETPGAPLVAVIGFDLWQFRFAGDVRAVGRDMTIAGVPHTIVGVMPRTFRFPANQQLWLPLRNRADAPDDRPLVIVGRLAPGASAAGAQAQLSALGHREASGTADARAALVPEVVPYSYWSALVMGGPRGGIRATPEYYLSQALTLGLLVVACVNVGLLIFARTASRSEELAVRTALGASRARIVTQLFTESLVLAALSAGLGLVLIDRLPALLIGLATRGQMPFWIDLGVGRETVFWTVALAVLSAAVVGIAPALRITGRSVRHHIQHARASRSGRGFGGASGVLIVADVAIAVATVGLAAGLSYQLGQSLDGRAATGVDAARYLAAELRFAASGSREQAAHAERQRALVSRLEAEPGVQGVAVASVLPRMDHPVRTIEADGGAGADPGARHRVRVARVGPGYFEALGRPVISGRAFDAHDFRDGGTAVVVVNATFVDNVLGGRNPIGVRIRFEGANGTGRPGPWREIVGVVGHLGMHVLNPGRDEGVYLPLEPGTTPVHLAIRVAGDPVAFAPRLRALAREVDPALSVGVPAALDTVLEDDWYLMAGMALGGGALVVLLLALAASGLYAIMSFAVAARTREFGIRAALGASRAGIALAVTRRAVVQVALGAALGTPVAARIAYEFLRDAGGTSSGAAVIAVALAPGLAVMLVVSVIACTAPTLRALRVTPAEALRLP